MDGFCTKDLRAEASTVFSSCISQLYFSTVFLNFEIFARMVSAQRNGGIKCKEKATAADCLQGAEGQTAPGVTNQKLMTMTMTMTMMT